MENAKYLVRGPQRRLLVTTTLDPAELGKDEVIIQVNAIAPNSGDCNMIDHGHKVSSWPFVPGLEGAGVIQATGSSVEHVAVGDRVLAQFAPGERSGAFQKFAVLHKGRLAKIPDTWSIQEAATIGVAYFTSMLMMGIGLKMPLPFLLEGPNEGFSPSSVLVVDGYTGVGAATIQLLRLAVPECNILATASSEHHIRILSLGADAVFDRDSDTLVEDIKSATPGKSPGVDVIVDTVGAGRTLPEIFAVFASDGPKKYAQVWTDNSAVQVPEGVELVVFKGQDLSALPGGQNLMQALQSLMDDGLYKLPVMVSEMGHGFDALEKALEVVRGGGYQDRIVITL